MIRIATLSPVVAVLLMAGCVTTDGFEPYYPDQSDPKIQSLEPAFEDGNVGGQEVVISGSGFGDNVDGVVVLVAHHNAEVLSVEDSAITIVTPPGPITGGAVDLVVATESGYVESDAAYKYKVGPLDGSDDDFYADETAYILVNNYWNSCYGGMGEQEYDAGCEDISYMGDAGIDGMAEFFKFAYPRISTPDHGWSSSTDHSPMQWHFSDAYNSPYASGIDDLRQHVGNFTLTNRDSDANSFSVDLACDDHIQDGADGTMNLCDGDDPVMFDPKVLRFCETEHATEGPEGYYQSEWYIQQPFFADADGDPLAPVNLTLDAPEAGVAGVDITLPGAVRFYAVDGYNVGGDQLPESLWSVAYLNDCMDEDGDGSAYLNEEGMVLSWDPIGDDVEVGGDGVEAHSYVHVSVSLLTLGWFGGEGYPIRASIAVPDTYQVDEATGRSTVGIPNSILYQFPTPEQEWSGTNQMGLGYLGDHETEAAYMIIEIKRVTDLRIPRSDGAGDLVMSYVTGDFAFSGWENPTEGDGCHNCLDDDGDGWADALDPDCIGDAGGNGSVEDRSNDANFSCADGIDNDGQNGADSDDPLCESGIDSESTCGNGIDDDNDGWMDEVDADCINAQGEFDYTLQEDGSTPNGDCADGLDTDLDGWIDEEDPDCLHSGMNELGVGDTECNDGIDNDGHGDVDAADPYCALHGPLSTEAPEVFSGECVDNDLTDELFGIDEDDQGNDGFIDSLDPDCEIAGAANVEFYAYLTEDDGRGAFRTTCYNGLDDDSDGLTDAADPSCWRWVPAVGNFPGGYLPDGFLSEDGSDPRHPDDVDAHSCFDTLDNDGDGTPDNCVFQDDISTEPWNQTESND